MTDTPVAEMSFEAAMAELEALVNKLEGAEVPLDTSIQLYERGAELKRHCEAKLKSAEEKIAQITFAADGTPSGTKPVEG